MPLVVRLEGTNVEARQEADRRRAGLPLITADDLGDAAQKAVKAAGGKMKATKIAFTGIPVTDIKRARDFYEGVLGLKALRRI